MPEYELHDVRVVDPPEDPRRLVARRAIDLHDDGASPWSALAKAQAEFGHRLTELERDYLVGQLLRRRGGQASRARQRRASR